MEGDPRFPDNNNIIDLPWWNEDYTWTGSTGLYWPQQPGEYAALGMKADGFEPAALAISAGSPYSVMNNSLQVLLTMLRNAEKLTITVVDENGNVVKTIAEEEFVRGNYLESEENPSWYDGWEQPWFWDGTDAQGKALPEGQYFVRVQAYPGKLITGQDTATQVMSMPVRIDRTQPKASVSLKEAVLVTKNVFVPTASVVTLTLTGADESSILGYVVSEEFLPAGFDKENTATTQLKLSQLSGTEGKRVPLPVSAVDGAGNAAGAFAYVIYDDPSTKPTAAVQSEVAGENATVKLNIAHAPGASFTLEVVSKADGSSVYKTSGVVTTADYDFITAVKLPSAGAYTVKVAVTDIYGSAAAAELVLEAAGD